MFFFQLSTNNTKKIKHVIIVTRLSKLVLCHLRQGFHFHRQFLSFLLPCFYLRMNLRFKLREYFEIFPHIFHIGEDFTTATCPFSHMNLSLLALTSCWWSCDIFLLTSSEGAIFQEHVHLNTIRNSNISIRIWG